MKTIKATEKTQDKVILQLPSGKVVISRIGF